MAAIIHEEKNFRCRIGLDIRQRCGRMGKHECSWVEVGHNNEFRVCSCGRIQSCRGGRGRFCKDRRGEWRDLTPAFKSSDYTGAGYLVVNFRWPERRGSNEYLHRIIASVFCPKESPEAREVDHIDGNRMNNASSNLRWVTRAENAAAAARRGAFKGIHEFSGAIKQKDLPFIDAMISAGFLQKEIAAFYGVHKSCVSRYVSGQAWRKPSS